MRRGGPLPSAAADAVSSPGRSFTPLRKLPRIDPLHQTRPRERQQMEPIDHNVLPSGIRSRFVDNINGLRMHVLEAGFETKGRPCLLLLHGFPELASFRLLNLVRDALGLVSAFGYRSVEAVVGHDFGSSVAAWCALVRPDVFRSVVLMSAPFAGPPQLAFNTADAPPGPKPEDPVHRELAALPRPRKHYQWYYSTREANADMHRAPQGVHDFLRAYYHHKSAEIMHALRRTVHV